MSGDPPIAYVDVRDASTGALLLTRSDTQTFTAAQPCQEIEYPVAFGDSWVNSCDLGFGPVETTYTVAGQEERETPAGTFTALTVDAVGTDAARFWLAEEVCGKVAEFAQVNVQQTDVNLTAFRCAARGTSPTPTSATPTPTASNASTVFDYTCPQERARWPNFTQAECDRFEADGDLVDTAWERDRGDTNPYAADTDGDGRSDNDDKFGRDPGRQSPGASAVLAVALVAAAALAWRRKPS